jgi:hypothetical protein
LALISWALVHGLVVPARDGALQGPPMPDATDTTDATELAHSLADLFTQYISADLVGRPTDPASNSATQ